MDLMMLAVFCCFFCFENLRSLEVTSFEWYDDARESFEFAWIYMFKQATACQPPTREICCIGPGIVDS